MNKIDIRLGEAGPAQNGTSCRLQVAALPWRRVGDTIEIMLITSRDTGRWVLPKGWPEVGEMLCVAAAREAEEEAGVVGGVSTRAEGRYNYAKGLSRGRQVNCEVLVYPLEVAEVADSWKERGQRTRRWVSPAEAAGMVAEPELAGLLAAFRR